MIVSQGNPHHVLRLLRSCLVHPGQSTANLAQGCSFIKGTAAFRIPWGLQMLPAIGLLVGLMFMPESPRWLARKGRWDEAKAVLTLVHGKGDPHSLVAANELEDIKKAVEIEAAAANVTYFDLLRPNMINRTHIGLFMQIWSQLTGKPLH